MAQTIQVSISIQIGVRKNIPQVVVPANVNAAVLVLDTSWLTDPTALIMWGLEVSLDGGSTWRNFVSGSRAGGVVTGDRGEQITTVDIRVITHNPSFDIRGDPIRGFIGVVQGDQPLVSPQTVTGTLTLS